MKRLLGGIAAVCLASGLASAQPAPEQAAKVEFDKGNTAYNLGKWDEAVDHFTKAYEAWSRPEFLYNIAQAYRQAGNCKQALYFYKRFRSLEENDTAAPLGPKKLHEIDHFIEQLTACAAQTDTTANTKPDSLAQPPPAPATPAPVATPPAAATARPATAAPAATPAATAALEPQGPRDDDEDHVSASAATKPARPTVVSLRAVSGIALMSAGDLDIPIQPSFGVTAGYPLALGPVELDLGAGVSYTPLPYQAMGVQQRGAMVGARAVVAAAVPVASRIALRGELGAGIVSLTGLEMGNPLVDDRSARSFTLLDVRFGVAADFAITRNLTATLSPFTFGISPGATGLYGGSLREIDVLAGLGYRQ